MSLYANMSKQQLQAELESQQAFLASCKEQNLKLNMARGKPAKQQLDAVSDILSVITTGEECFDGALDTRNYGELAGIPSARAYWAEVLGCQADQTFIGGSASLNLMFDVIAKAYSHGLLHSPKPWCKEECVKFLCPSPGYDRHFRITQFFGAELITIPMTATGPDMDLVEELVKDPAVKGIWCVPKYSNPAGITFSDETVRRFAKLNPKAKDFKIFWDNAYLIHDLYDEHDHLLNIHDEAGKFGNEDMVFEFLSTSKVTIAGGGVCFIASSEKNIAWLTSMLALEGLGYDKVNQLRHVKFFRDENGVYEIMKKHASILRPKFEAVLKTFTEDFGDSGFANWHAPRGGYFISLDVMPGCAKRTWELASQIGVTLTGAGATFPYGKDPEDKNLRIAPSNVKLDDITIIAKYVVICSKIAALEKVLSI